VQIFLIVRRRARSTRLKPGAKKCNGVWRLAARKAK